MVEISDRKLPGFLAKMRAAGCYLEADGHILLIQQGLQKVHEGMWGVPGGKVEPNETLEEAAKRELLEETGIVLSPSSKMRLVATLYCREDGHDFEFCMFQIELDHRPIVRLSFEHSAYQWVEMATFEALSLPLRPGADRAWRYYLQATGRSVLLA